MSAGGRQTGRKGRRKAVRKPPPHWRRYLTQAELELPPPAGGPPAGEADDRNDEFEYADAPDLAWWQSRLFVAGLAAACMLLAVLTVTSMINAAREREAARVAAEREQTLTLRAINSVRSLRIAPNPRSWSASPDLTLAWPEPPQLLELRLAVGYSPFLAFGVIVDKVDHGRVLLVERMAPDSNKELRLSLNSSAFGPGEYRLRLQGYTWRGDRIDVGWVRLLVTEPR
ncbi:MAG: hypothetical protein V9E93_05600 [Steroidobacteraceae bacterium]|nr:hypothetical protein [Steroidobacteraceae bacterium]MBP7015236.1 hypothetical protein [Steroidobacteraceae bacterium]